MSAVTVDAEARVLVGLSQDPPRQSRWSVLFRAVLAIPLLLVGIAISIGAFVAIVAAWFASLVTGRVPDGLQRFLTNALRFFANVLAYEYLLVARWPGVAFHEKPRDQVSVDVDHVGLRRWAVFFRFVLGYPANLVSGLLSLGSLPLLVVMWFWGVVAGREPRCLHQAMALVLRYQLRFQSYWCLLTPTQPFRGLYGDGSAPTTDLTSQSLEAVGASPSGAATASTPSRPTTWLVTRATKVALTMILVLGVPVYAASALADRPLINRVENALARSIVTSTYNDTVNAMSEFSRATSICNASLSASSTSCDGNAAVTASAALSQASSSLANATFTNTLVPTSDLDALLVYEGFLSRLQDELSAVATASSVQLQKNVIRNEMPSTLLSFATAYRTLDAKLGGGSLLLNETAVSLALRGTRHVPDGGRQNTAVGVSFSTRRSPA
jgi:Domain of unknown function (DUF4389)